MAPDLIGIPWLDRGRDRAGCDCWGLLRLALHEGTGILLPSYREDYADARDGLIVGLVEADRQLWRPVPRGAERAYDAVLLHDRPWHVGLVVRPGLMLHVPEGRASVIEPFTTGRFGRRVEGVYRHRRLA